jgi:hypothetical protein
LSRSDPTNTTFMDTFCAWTCDTWKFMKNILNFLIEMYLISCSFKNC